MRCDSTGESREAGSGLCSLAVGFLCHTKPPATRRIYFYMFFDVLVAFDLDQIPEYL